VRACVHVGTRQRGRVHARKCLANSARNSYAPYCVICGPSFSTIFFGILINGVIFGKTLLDLKFGFQSNLNFLDRLSKKVQTSSLIRIRPVGAELFHADRQTDMTKLFAILQKRLKWFPSIEGKTVNIYKPSALKLCFMLQV
jgi:hypothetical protein